MFRWGRSLAIAAVLSLANIATGADILLDNTSAGVSTVSTVPISSTAWSAVIFTVGGTGFTIGEIRMIPTSTTELSGDLTLSLFAASANVPTGAALASKTVSGVTFAPRASLTIGNAITVDTTVGSTGNWQITSSQQYAIVLSASVVAAYGVSDPSTMLSTGTSGLTFQGRSGSFNSGGSWLGPFSSNIGWMSVTAVPEPSTWVMGMIGCGFVAILTRHRVRRNGPS